MTIVLHLVLSHPRGMRHNLLEDSFVCVSVINNDHLIRFVESTNEHLLGLWGRTVILLLLLRVSTKSSGKSAPY